MPLMKNVASSKKRVLHLPETVGNQSYYLAQGEKRHGFDSTLLSKHNHRYHIPADIKLNLSGRPRLLQAASQLKAFIQARNNYDIFHFNYGTSLLDYPGKGLPLMDLPFYPKDKKLFVTYQGCDARQKYPTMERLRWAACHNRNCYGGKCNSGQLDLYRKNGIEKMSRYVEHMWALNPDLLRFLPKDKSSFLPYAVGPTTLNTIDTSNKKLRIVHAPTNRAAKGSEHIMHTMKLITARFPNDVEFICIENMPIEVAQREYVKSDLVIDQVLIGWYGAFAVECMLMKKPIICRIEDSDLNFIPEQMRKDLRETVIDCTPENLEEKICSLIENRSALKRFSTNSFEYATRWHDPKFVASLVVEKYLS